MRTLYVTIPDKLLQDLIEKYENACPITEEYDFAVYLALKELQRIRGGGAVTPF